MFKPKGGGIKGLGGGGIFGNMKRAALKKAVGITGLPSTSAPLPEDTSGGSKYVNLEIHF